MSRLPGASVTALSLFAGCGGLDLGASRAGAEVVWATDRMPESADALAALLPDAEFILADVRDLHGFPQVDLVLGGYPCQPFSMGGVRNPANDRRARLFAEFGRAIAMVQPRYFVAENVIGMRSLGARRWLQEQVELFRSAGRDGYFVSVGALNAADYGLPQHRRRLFIVGVRRDLRHVYCFPPATHGDRTKLADGLKPWESHGDALALANLPPWPEGEFYERPLDPDQGFSWWYMSRNRKAPWDAPARTILANERQVALHPASFAMRLLWSRTHDGSKQRWEFTGEYDHLSEHPDRLALERPRRLSWRECAVLQSFPATFEPTGSRRQKYEQIGNAVPPVLAEAVVRPLIDGSGLCAVTNLRDLEREQFGLPKRGKRR
jgi:DNA (cytosine-5)-methyltransferase 1